jgi:REP element-mobilizing transposase RayT
MWNLPAPPGFKGFDPNGPARVYTRNLPHWRQEGATYFVTFRLGDSLPAERLAELEALRQQWEHRHPNLRSKEVWEKLAKTTLARLEQWLDEGSGSCVLREGPAAAEVERTLRHYDGEQYELAAYVVMPNHVHLLVRPFSDKLHPLERLEQAWKSNSARAINRQHATEGALWQAESFDRMVRDEEHLWKCLQYIGSNSRRAGLNLESCPRWVRPQWVELGWKFDG